MRVTVRAQQGTLSTVSPVQQPATFQVAGSSSLLIWPEYRRHISASKAARACFAANLGFKEIHVEARPGDVMAGVGGAAGPAPDVRHQPTGTPLDIYYNYGIHNNAAASTVVNIALQSA